MVWLWSGIERDLAREIAAFGATPVHGPRRNLDLWESLVGWAGPARPVQTDLCRRLVTRLKDALDMRNAICHGLCGISAETETQPAHLTAQLGDGPERRFDWPLLQDTFAWLSRAGGLIGALSNAARMADATEAEAHLAAWAEFPA